MFKVSNSIFLKDKKMNDEYYNNKYKINNRVDLRKNADFTNETPEQVTDNFVPLAPPAPSAPPVQSTDCTVQQNNNDINQQNNDDINQQNNNQNTATAASKDKIDFRGMGEAKTMYQNGLIGSIAPTSDYWEDNSYECFVPHSDWNSPSSAIWSPAAANLYGRF